jgi:hypothetical protein
MAFLHEILRAPGLGFAEGARIQASAKLLASAELFNP